MNQVYTLTLRVIVAAHKASRDVSLRLKRYVDFVPYEGMRIRFSDEDGNELELTLMNLVYDYTAKEFIEEQEDDTLFAELRDAERPECTITKERMAQYLEQYTVHGFEVML